MCCVHPDRQRRWWTRHFWLPVLIVSLPTTLGYFLGDSKAVLNGCVNRWTLQDSAAMPLLFQMTVCVHVRVVDPGPWVAFTYSSAHAPRPELGLEGDGRALYGWLLGVRHHFPLRLPPTLWHRVCLRRDVLGNSFSLEVDGELVAERTVIAQAIPPSGSLRLGCRLRDRPPGETLGEVELYLFRVWADLDQHADCEDGSVIGWDSRFWGVNSARARQRDPSLLCAKSNGHRQSETTGPPMVDCDISPLCSNDTAYYWMFVGVKAKNTKEDEEQVKCWVSDVFRWENTSHGWNITQAYQDTDVFCDNGDRTKGSNCSVLLTFSHPVQLRELREKLQRQGEWKKANLIGELERVGRGLCTGVEPSSGIFVMCTSPSSLDDICQSTRGSNITCILTDPESIQTRSCQFFAIWINIISPGVNITHIENMLSNLTSATICDQAQGPCKKYSAVSERYKGSYLECRGREEQSLPSAIPTCTLTLPNEKLSRLYSCVVMLLLSGPVDVCALAEVVLVNMKDVNSITRDESITRMVVCGFSSLSACALLKSNLTWVSSDLDGSQICQPDRPLLSCEAHKTLAVLLTDSCLGPPPKPLPTNPSTSQASTVPNSSISPASEVTPSSPANTTQQSNPTVEASATTQHRTLFQPDTTTIPQASTQNATTMPTPMLTAPHLNTAAISQNTTYYGNVTYNTTLLNPLAETESPLNATQPVTQKTTSYNVMHVNTTPGPLNKTSPAKVHTTQLNTTLSATQMNMTSSSKQKELESNATHPHTTSWSTQINATLDSTTSAPAKEAFYNTTPKSGTVAQTTTPGSVNTTLFLTTVSSPELTVDSTTDFMRETGFHSTTTAPDNATVSNTIAPGISTPFTPAYSINQHNMTTSQDNTTQVKLRASTTSSLLNTTTPPVDEVIPAANNQTLQNTTAVPPNTPTVSSNNTAVHNITTASNNGTGQENTKATSIATASTTVTSPPNYTDKDNATTAATEQTLYNTTADSTTLGNVTLSLSAAAPLNTTMYNWMTTTTSYTHEKTNYTTTAMPFDLTTATTPKDGNLSTATPIASVNLGDNMTTGANFNHSSTLSAGTGVTKHDFTQTTTGPVFSLTTAMLNNLSVEPIALLSTPLTTAVGKSMTTHGPSPAVSNEGHTTTMDTAKVFITTATTTRLKTITATSATTTSASRETTKTSLEEFEEEVDLLLEQQTQDTSQLNSTQVEQMVGKLEKLLEGPTVSQSVGQKAIDVISILMNGEAQALAASANRLIRMVDDLGLKLVVVSESEVLSSDSLALAVRRVDGTNFPATSFTILNPSEFQLTVLGMTQATISEAFQASISLPSSLTEGLSPEEQQLASRVQFTFYTTASLFQDAALGNQTIVSSVLAASVANLSISNLRENIHFTFQNAISAHENYEASCVFWDFTMNGGGGGWNSSGCFLLNDTEENITCSCNHLTSFAILLDLSREGLMDRQQATILTYVTYIGCGISAIFLSVTLLTYLSFQKLLRDIPSKILVQLCLSLLLLNLLFLLDGWLALYPVPGLCISTAFFLHYFLLTSFTWAGLEALHMYLSIVRVFTPYLSRYMLKFSLLGWGIPFIVVIIVISVDKDNYGLVSYGKYRDGTSDDFCWLRNNIAFYVGVVAYFLLIFALSVLVFIVVLVQLARIKRQNPQNQSPQRGLMTDLRSITGLVILLGLTWGFALFAWGPFYLPFIYLFSIFNSLQGFFIFLLHCAVKENVRRQWRTHLCCGRLRLAENSEWSRTATQNPKTLLVTTQINSSLNPFSRSSSIISEGTSSSGSVFADSGVSDGSNGDVVLNEIHRRYMAVQNVA